MSLNTNFVLQTGETFNLQSLYLWRLDSGEQRRHKILVFNRGRVLYVLKTMHFMTFLEIEIFNKLLINVFIFNNHLIILILDSFKYDVTHPNPKNFKIKYISCIFRWVSFLRKKNNCFFFFHGKSRQPFAFLSNFSWSIPEFFMTDSKVQNLDPYGTN